MDVHRQSPHAVERAQDALSKVRNLSCLLHPPLLDESGLIPALHWYFEELQNRGQLSILFEYRPVSFPRLANEIGTALFRIIQESRTNIYRHAESKEARIDITEEAGEVIVRVRDFGKGMPESKSGISHAGAGSSGMKERVQQLNGVLRISRAEPGILVVATIPLVELPRSSVAV